MPRILLMTMHAKGDDADLVVPRTTSCNIQLPSFRDFRI